MAAVVKFVGNCVISGVAKGVISNMVTPAEAPAEAPIVATTPATHIHNTTNISHVHVHNTTNNTHTVESGNNTVHLESVGIQMAISVITNLINDLFSDDIDETNPFTAIYANILQLQQNLRDMHVDLSRQSKEIKYKLSIVTASVNYIESYLRASRADTRGCFISINICNKIEKLVEMCKDRFDTIIFNELRTELLNYFMHYDRFGTVEGYNNVKLCIIIENVILLHINIIDDTLLNQCILTYIRLRRNIRSGNYDKRFAMVGKLQEKLNEHKITRAAKFEQTKQAKLQYIDTVSEKCILTNKNYRQFLAYRKREYELTSVKPPSTRAALCYDECRYTHGQWHYIKSMKSNADIKHLENDKKIIIFPEPNEYLVLIPLEINATIPSDVVLAHKMGIIDLRYTYSITIAKKYQYNYVDKILDAEYFDESVDDHVNRVVVKSAGTQDNTHGQTLPFICTINMVVDDKVVCSKTFPLPFVVGRNGGCWIYECVSLFGYFRINPTFIGNVLMNDFITYNSTNPINMSHTVNVLQFINEERKLLHEKYRSDLVNLTLKTSIQNPFTSIYSTNLVELKQTIQRENLIDYDYNVSIICL